MTKVPRQRRKELRAVAALRDTQIDFSDAAEVRDWSHAVVGSFYRPDQEVTYDSARCGRARMAKSARPRLANSDQQVAARRHGEAIGAPESMNYRRSLAPYR